MEDIKELFNNLREAKVQVRHINNIYDYPGTTLKDEIKGIELMEEYPEICKIYGNLRLSYNKHSQISMEPEKFGVKILKTEYKNYLGYKYEIIQENGIGEKDLQQIERRLKRMNIIQKAINEYELQPNVAKIKMYNPREHSIKVRTESDVYEIETRFDKEGNASEPKTITKIGWGPLGIATMSNQDIIKNMETDKEYSFEDLRRMVSSEEESTIQNQKVFMTIMNLANERVFSSMEFRTNH